MLTRLEKAEIRRFKEFVYSPYWNKNESLRQLCDFIIKFHGKFEQEKFCEKEAFKVIKPNQPFKEKVIPKLLSKLYKLFENFIITERTDNESIIQKLHYLSFLGGIDQMHDYNLYLEVVNKTLDAIETTAQRRLLCNVSSLRETNLCHRRPLYVS